jgi:hypothetical protein
MAYKFNYRLIEKTPEILYALTAHSGGGNG